MSNEITISIAGKKYSGWTKVVVRRSIESLAGSFNFKVTDRLDRKNNENWPLKTQSSVQVKVGSDFLINGYIDNVDVTIEKGAHFIQVSGRDKTEDLIDTSAIQKDKKYRLPSTNMLKLANTLATPYGINVEVGPGTNVSKTFDISFKTSESPFEILDRKAKELGILLLTTPEGSLLLTNSKKEKSNDSIILGVNALKANVNYNFVNRFSKYIVNAQDSNTSSGWENSINVTAEAEDPNVNRFRPLLIQAESGVNRERAQTRANWEANVRAARSQTINVSLQGLRQTNDDLWEINKLVDVLAPALYINPATSLLISTVEYDIGPGGSFTRLSLKRKDSYQPLPPRKVKAQNNLGWS